MKQFYLRSGVLTSIVIVMFGFLITAGMMNGPAAEATLSAKDTGGAHASIDASMHTITVRELGGYVAVYRDGSFAQMTDIPVSSLPGNDREALSHGIEVADETDLHRLLEDLGA